MENLNDTPARFEENEQYLRDPESPQAKPYSTKQLMANDSHAQNVWVYDKEEGGKLVSREEAEDLLADGWKDEPYEHPNNPNAKKSEKVVETDEVKALRDELDEMGIDYDKRWGAAKLKKALLDDDG